MTISFDGGRCLVDGAPVPYRETPNKHAGKVVPKYVVIHETAGRLDKGNSVSWLANPKAKASAHFVIERDGSITQMADLLARTWHAGRSSWKGVSGLNDYSIGIEVVGPGKLSRSGAAAKAWFGVSYPIDEYGVQEVFATTHGSGLWMPWTEAQRETVEELVRAICAEAPIEEIVGHYQISPGRKVDPSPLVDLDALNAVALTKSEPGDSLSDGRMTIGEAGPKVRLAQERLAELGYKVGYADGIFGPLTRDAAMSFLVRNGREVRDHLTREDFEALLAADAVAWAPSDTRQTASPTDVAAVDDKMATAQSGKRVAGGTAALVTGATALEKIAEYSDTATRATDSVDALWNAFVSHWQAAALIVACVALYFWWGRIEKLILRDHREGKNV